MQPQILKHSQVDSSALKSIQAPSGSTEIPSALKQLGRRGVFGDVAAKGVLRYLRKTSSFALEFDASLASLAASSVNLECAVPRSFDGGYCDADWASDTATRRSVSGYAFFLFGGLVSWSSVKQKTVALSSTEAEYTSITHCLREGLWIHLFTTLLELREQHPLPLHVDNRGALDTLDASSTSNRMKHIDVKYHFIRDHVHDGSFVATWIPTDRMVADILTKPLGLILHRQHSSSLGLVPLTR